MTKLDVLDSITKLEDKYESDLRDQVELKVTSDIISKYGDLGKEVCAIYYKKDSPIIDKDDCPECAKKAKELIKKLKVANSISESINNSDFEKWYDSVSEKIYFKGFIENISIQLRNKLEINGIKTTDTLVRNLLIRLIVNCFDNIS